MKTVFMGTPEPAVPFLKVLNSITEVKLVITQPDRPRGRGLVVSPCPVKEEALKLGLPVMSPASPSEAVAVVKESGAALAVVVAYGRILRKDMLAAFPFGCMNIHFSVLPAYRGAAPVQWAVINGEKNTGVTSFWLDEGMDTGPVCLARSVPIANNDDAASLMAKLVSLGADVLRDSIKAVDSMALSGDALSSEKIAELQFAAGIRVPQTGHVSSAPLIDKRDSVLDFLWPAEKIHNRVRGLALGPAPRAMCSAGGREFCLHVLKTGIPDSGKNTAPDTVPAGTIVRVERGSGFIVQCGIGELLIEVVRPEGKKSVSAWDFFNGFKLKAGDRFFVLGR